MHGCWAPHLLSNNPHFPSASHPPAIIHTRRALCIRALCMQATRHPPSTTRARLCVCDAFHRMSELALNSIAREKSIILHLHEQRSDFSLSFHPFRSTIVSTTKSSLACSARAEFLLLQFTRGWISRIYIFGTFSQRFCCCSLLNIEHFRTNARVEKMFLYIFSHILHAAF